LLSLIRQTFGNISLVTEAFKQMRAKMWWTWFCFRVGAAVSLRYSGHHLVCKCLDSNH
jgi:hypothetical protein